MLEGCALGRSDHLRGEQAFSGPVWNGFYVHLADLLNPPAVDPFDATGSKAYVPNVRGCGPGVGKLVR